MDGLEVYKIAVDNIRVSGHNKNMKNHNLELFLLRLGIASVFLYAAIAGCLEPQNWIGYLPQFLRNIFPATTLLMFLGIYEIILSLWLLWGKKVFWAALISAFTLLGIIVTNIGALDIVFRDIAILFAALSLAVSTYELK